MWMVGRGWIRERKRGGGKPGVLFEF